MRIAAKVSVLIEVADVRTGEILQRMTEHNMVVDAGLDLLRDLIYGDSVPLTHGAVGTDGAATEAEDVALAAEVFRDQISQRTKTDQTLTVKFVVGSQSANGVTLREAGLFTAASGGIMYARVTPEEVAKTDSILVIYTWTLSWGRP